MSGNSTIYKVKMGHAPIPTIALKPKQLHPLDSRGSLFKYIKENGVINEFEYADEQRARDVAAGYVVPVNSMWAKQIVARSEMKGLPERELLFKSGFKI
jgi:hypothetical protein